MRQDRQVNSEQADCCGKYRVVAFDSKTRTYLLENAELENAEHSQTALAPLNGGINLERSAKIALHHNLSGVPNPDCWVRSSASLRLGQTVMGCIFPHPAVAAQQQEFSTFTPTEES